jgi:hypothetical protein
MCAISSYLVFWWLYRHPRTETHVAQRPLIQFWSLIAY